MDFCLHHPAIVCNGEMDRLGHDFCCVFDVLLLEDEE